MRDYHSICALPEEIPEEKRGPFKLYRVKCGYAFDHKYITETFHVRDANGEVLKSFKDFEKATIYAGKQYTEYLKEQDKLKNDGNG